MMFSRIKELLILGGSILLLGMVSCNKVTDGPVQEADSGVVPAKVSMWAKLGDGTKASYASGGKVSWELGDKIVLYDPDAQKVLSELVCISTSDDGKGFFSGPDPESWSSEADGTVQRVFFLGNRNIAEDATEITVDFSAQDGTASGLGRFIFLYKDYGESPLTFSSTGDGGHLANETISFERSFNAIVEMTFSGENGPAGTPGVSGYKAKKITIERLTNKLSINLASGTATPGYANEDPYKTIINPGSVAKYANKYFLSVAAPQTAQGESPELNTSVTITADYQNGGTGTTTVKWEPFSWAGITANNWYWINWESHTGVLQLSSKGGYNGQSVTGGENANGQSSKGGYNGVNADGENENPTGNKVGYNGTEVL